MTDVASNSAIMGSILVFESEALRESYMEAQYQKNRYRHSTDRPRGCAGYSESEQRLGLRERPRTATIDTSQYFTEARA